MQSLIKALGLGIVAAFAVTACSSSGNTASSSAESSAAPAESTAAAPAESSNAMAAGGSPGQKVYETNCSSCHQTNGKGTPGAFPPLAGNAVVTGDPKKVIHIVKYGLSGKVAVGSQSFNGMMPAWGTQLSDGDIASAVTYIRSSWGNKASAVSATDVTAVTK